jgi:AcrR family transcriptional regulator
MGSKTPRNAREAVLESAIAEFAQRGYSGASIHDILKVTGLSKPTLYYYFQSKAGLYRAILDFAFDECLARMQKALAKARGMRGRLVAVAAAMFEFAEERPQLLRLVFGSIFAAPEEIPAECTDLEKRRRNWEFVKNIIEEELKAGKLDARFSAVELTHGLYGAISHQTRMHLLCGEGKLDAGLAERVVDLFLNGAKK